MSERFKALLSPLNLAGLIVLGAIFWELLDDPEILVYSGFRAPGLLLVALLAAFTALFLLQAAAGPSSGRARWLVLVQAALALALMVLASERSLSILWILVAAQAVRHWSPATAMLAALALNALLYGVYAALWQLSAPLVTTLGNGSFQLFAGITAWYAIAAVRNRDQLAAVNSDLLATRSLLAETARDAERLRLSRELHDVAGHKLTALKLNLAAVVRDPRWAGETQLALCARLADELLADIRGVVQQMRRDEGIDLSQAVRNLAAPFPRPQVQVEIAANARANTIEQAEAVLRTVQEAITNAARHSHAQHLWVVLRRDGDTLQLDIRDDGRSYGPLIAGNGLAGMRERLEALDGGLRIERSDTGGVRLQAWLPVSA